MWVVTIFEEDTHRIFEFETKEEALAIIETIENPAILTFTNLTLVA
ncbi:hypothetical protein [Lysinibacillus yapensis]|nr:hypothetical protein [Lysinibacillus yapensis]